MVNGLANAAAMIRGMWQRITRPTRRLIAAGYGPAASLAFIAAILGVDVAFGMTALWSMAAAFGLVALMLFLAEVTGKKKAPPTP